MKLLNLKSKFGSRKKSKEVGRGRGSGHGKTCCKGHNGQIQRSGSSIRAGFEGGQTPMYRRLPKFQTNERVNRLSWKIVNLRDLEKLSECKQITPQVLLEKGIIDDIDDGVRILGDGEIKFSTHVKAHYFSESAKKKIEASGGKCELINNLQGKGQKSEKIEKGKK